MRETVVRVLAASSILSCGVAFIQRAGGVDFGLFEIAGQHRVSSTMYIMTFAGVMSQLTVFYSATLIARIGRNERILYGVAAVLQMFAVMLTMTRGAWLGGDGRFRRAGAAGPEPPAPGDLPARWHWSWWYSHSSTRTTRGAPYQYSPFSARRPTQRPHPHRTVENGVAALSSRTLCWAWAWETTPPRRRSCSPAPKAC